MSADEMTQTIQKLHLSDLLDIMMIAHYRMAVMTLTFRVCYQALIMPTKSKDRSPHLQLQMKHLVNEYHDIVIGKAMSVPSIQFSMQLDRWESNPKHVPSRLIFVETHEALK